MPSITLANSKIKQSLFAVALAMICSLCIAASRMGTAEVSDKNGMPCFALPSDPETRDGLPLYVLAVTEVKSVDGMKTPPEELWYFTAADFKMPPQLRPTDCIRYGETPASTLQRTLKPLQPFHPYSVSIVAREKSSSMLAYVAEFCVKPDHMGRTTVQIISSVRSEGDKRYGVCARTK